MDDNKNIEIEIIKLVENFNSKHFDDVIASSLLLINQYPKLPILYNLLGASYASKDNNTLAIKYFKEAIKLDENNFEYYNNIGKSFFSLGFYDDAKLYFEKSLKIKKDNPDTYFNIGLIYQEQKNYEKSKFYYTKSLEINKNFSIASYNLAIVYTILGEYFLAEEYYKKVISIDPNYYKAYNNYSSILILQKRYTEAKKNLDKAILLKPTYKEAIHNLGILYLEKKNYLLSLKYFTENTTSDPNYLKSQVQKMYIEKKMCNWKYFNTYRSVLDKINDQKSDDLTPWQMLSLDDNPKFEFQRAKTYGKKFSNKNSSIKINKKNKIRIGYFTPDFYEHAGMMNMEGIFKNHNKNEFEIYGFDYGNNKDDLTHKRITSYFDKFFYISDLSDKKISELSRENKIDIAIHRNGYSQNSRTNIFSYRTAPIQISFLGYPGTLGLNYIDYIIADQIVIPEENNVFFSEKIIYLPDTYYPTFNERKIANLSLTRKDLGISKDSFVMCCFNNSYKISPVEFDIWMKVLKKIEDSYLILLADNSNTIENLLEEAKKRNVDSNQIKFFNYIKIDEHLSRHQIGDLYLDTFNYNGHTSVVDSLWSGLPVITKVGNSFSARVGASLLNSLNMSQMITKNEIEYEKLILKIGLNVTLRNKLKFDLIKNIRNASLFNTSQYVKYLEKGFKKAYEMGLNNKKFENIFIESAK